MIREKTKVIIATKRVQQKSTSNPDSAGDAEVFSAPSQGSTLTKNDVKVSSWECERIENVMNLHSGSNIFTRPGCALSNPKRKGQVSKSQFVGSKN
jgi:hypothetical protein